MKNKVLKHVVSQMLNMYHNNVIEEYCNESFEGWCEDGKQFAMPEYELNEEEVAMAIKMMKALAPHIDALTNAIIGFENEEV